MEQKQFQEILRDKGLKVTAQRLLVLETIADHSDEHLTAEEIYELARRKYPEIGLATIYRTLQVLVGLHVIEKISLDDGFARYEFGKEGTDGHHHRHHHAVCLGCGAVISIEDDLLDGLEQAVRKRIGFQVTDHELNLYGFCRECLKKQNPEK